MDILLFNQYFASNKEAPEKILASVPLNLLYLASYLEYKGIKSRIYELGIFDFDKIIIEENRVRCGISNKEIIEIIEKENPKIVGLGCMYSRHYIDIISIANLIKSVNPSVKIVLGGNHATSFCNMVLKTPTIDFVVMGEGEITFYELCKEILSNKNNFKNIKGISYRGEKGEVINTPDRALIKNLDEFSLDFSLLNMKDYVSHTHKSPFLMRYPSMGIVSSRGCPGKCVYCTVKAVWGRGWRGKSAEKTVDEIELLHSKYGIQEFSFLDDSASLDKKRWNSICDEIINRKLDIRWTTPNGIAHWTLDKPTLKKMKIAGCYRVTFGIESGNIETRKFLGKTYSLKQAEEMLRYANKIGMWTICTNIIGFPYETKESMDDTLRFAKQSTTDFATFFLLAPQVTSDVYAFFKKEGLLDFDFIFNENVFDEEKYEEMNKMLNDRGAPNKYFTVEELKIIQMQSYRSFIIYRALTYLNPSCLLRKIRSIEDLRYTVRLMLAGAKILIKSFYKKTTKALLYE